MDFISAALVNTYIAIIIDNYGCT